MQRFLSTALVAPLLLWTGPACAEDVVETAAETDAVAALVAQPIPREFCLELGAALLRDDGSGEFAEPLDPHDFPSLEQTDGALDRLISARRLELLTIMRNESAAVFFGVNEKGRIGVHVDASQLMSPGR